MESEELKKNILDEEQIKDVKNIGRGVYAPLTGFLKENDFLSVLNNLRLSSGEIWPIPIVLDINEPKQFGEQEKILLLDREDKPLALLQNIEIYGYNKRLFAQKVFSTLDKNHPGVEEIYKMGDYLVGGDIQLLDNSKEPFPEYNFSPEETKKIFKEKGWKRIMAFQTRNVPHLGHEFLQKYALGYADGLFIQPVIGRKKIEDFKDEFILSAYELLIKEYLPKEKIFLGILPLKMRYAGPREAIFHALIRRNFGCTHFIVGRDHAGVGDYYGPYDAQKIFDNFKEEELGIKILKLENVVYCQKCQNHVFENGCSHQSEDKIAFSGTKLRNYIRKKEQPPAYLIRPEIYRLLLNSLNPLVDNIYKNPSNNQKGFVLWFTGLSQSGKSTIADKVYEILKQKGMKVERLDGDIIRKSLTKDLGFSKEDRDENIKRVGFVTQLLSNNGVGVIASFISPYREAREKVRKESRNFIEIFCRCPLEICEKRDEKGLYQLAREGKIKNFTGISDPYEEPENPEIVLDTLETDLVKDNAQKVINYLNNRILKD